jgi:hypothetical protein
LIDEQSSKCEFTALKPIVYARYGHCQLYNSGAVYIIGGFDHEDVIGVPPSTLTSCEIYVPPDDPYGMASVETVASLNIPRAYAGCCQIGNFIYIFGGLNGYETLSSIEQYNTRGYESFKLTGQSLGGVN